MKLLRRHRWHTVIPLYDIRECPQCGATVADNNGQLRHQMWHNEQPGTQPEPADNDPGGYIIGHGPLPASVRGGTDSED